MLPAGGSGRQNLHQLPGQGGAYVLPFAFRDIAPDCLDDSLDEESGAPFHLGRFLYDHGRADEAQRYFEEAAWHGDPDAVAVLEAEYRGLVDEYDD